MRDNFRLKGEFDYGLVFIAALILLMGLFVVYSASYQKLVSSGADLSMRQLNSAVIGLVIAVVIFRIG